MNLPGFVMYVQFRVTREPHAWTVNWQQTPKPDAQFPSGAPLPRIDERSSLNQNVNAISQKISEVRHKFEFLWRNFEVLLPMCSLS